MVHNHDAGFSSTGLGEDRSYNFTLDEAEVLFRAHLLVPLEYRLPHGWHLSNAGIMSHRHRKSRSSVPSSRSDEYNFQRRSGTNWCGLRTARSGRSSSSPEVSPFAGPGAGRFNRIGRRSWWYGRIVVATLAVYCYRPRIVYDPPRWVLCFPQDEVRLIGLLKAATFGALSAAEARGRHRHSRCAT
jgi:hypothetical protein